MVWITEKEIKELEKKETSDIVLVEHLKMIVLSEHEFQEILTSEEISYLSNWWKMNIKFRDNF